MDCFEIVVFISILWDWHPITIQVTKSLMTQITQTTNRQQKRAADSARNTNTICVLRGSQPPFVNLLVGMRGLMDQISRLTRRYYDPRPIQLHIISNILHKNLSGYHNLKRDYTNPLHRYKDNRKLGLLGFELGLNPATPEATPRQVGFVWVCLALFFPNWPSVQMVIILC